MSLKDELAKSIPTMELTEKEKASIRSRLQHYKERKISFKPAMISLAFFATLSVFILSALMQTVQEENAGEPLLNGQDPYDATSVGVDENSEEFSDELFEDRPKKILNLTDEQKQDYYEQYQKILDEANALKLGTHWGLSPIEEWEDSYWVTPEEFEKSVQEWIDAYLEIEREKVAKASTNLKNAKTENGITTKGTFIYMSGVFKEIEVSAEFETQYNEELNRQVFSGVNHVSTELVFKTNGRWEQTNYEATILDGGRTYSIRIEGIYTMKYSNGYEHSYEKAFTMEFTCDEVGNIS